MIELIHSDCGATAIEYGLIAVLIALVAIIAFQLLGTNITSVFSNIASLL